MRIVYLLPRLCSIFLLVGLKWDKGLAQNKYLSDEDYIPEEEEFENTTSSLDIDFNLENDVYGESSSVYKTSTVVYREKLDLRKYRRLAINDMSIDLHADDSSEDNENEEDIIKVYINYDILFDCDLPSEMFKGSFDWSVNGYLIGHNESSHTIIINEIETNPKFLNVSCYFELNEDTNEASSLQFPSIQIDKYYFKHVISNTDYFVLKYKKQLYMFKICLFITTIATLIIVAFSWGTYRSIK